MKRFRPFRLDAATRDLYADVKLSVKDFIYPYFIVDGYNEIQPIHSLKGISRFSPDELVKDLEETVSLGIDKILLFGVIENELKDLTGSAGYSPDSLVCRTIKLIKQHYPQVIVFTDVCLCEYTSHGHCGLLHGETVDNDSTLPLLAQMALVHAQAGADFVAPSAMMDGQVQAIKAKLKEYHETAKVLAYSAKYYLHSMVLFVMQPDRLLHLVTVRHTRWTTEQKTRDWKKLQLMWKKVLTG
jgi:porphobilinogen synthase